MMHRPKFVCVGYIGMSPHMSGLLYPVYHREGSNIPYVQEIDQDGKISGFVDFYDLEEFEFVRSVSTPTATFGDFGLFAFCHDCHLYEYDKAALEVAVRTERLEVEFDLLNSLTKLGLSRLAKLPSEKHLELFSEYMLRAGLSKEKVSQLVRVESRGLRELDGWWDRIHFSEFGESLIASDLRHEEIDTIINWLFRNEVSDDWIKIFSGVLRRVFFDERIDDLLMKFVSAKDDFSEFDINEKIILGRGLELYTLSPLRSADFADLIYDKVLDGSLFVVGNVLPLDLLRDFLIVFVIDKDNSGESLNIIDSLIDYLESDNVMPRIVDVVIDILFQSDLSQEYSENSFYASMNRFDRFIDVYRTRPLVRLSIRDESLIDTLDEILAEMDVDSVPTGLPSSNEGFC
ncbi:MAG: hypothetical protein R3D83_08455 [Caenibius sp.]